MAQKCHGEQPAQSRLGLSFGAFRTRLVFAERGTVDLEEWAIGGSFERKLSKAVTLQLSGGGIGYARLGGPGERTLRGFFAGAGASWAVVDQKGAIPLVMLGVSLAASLAVPEAGGDDALCGGRRTWWEGSSAGRWCWSSAVRPWSTPRRALRINTRNW